MKKKHLIRAGSYLVILVSGIYLFSAAADHLSSLKNIQVDRTAIAPLVLCLMLQLIITALGGAVWHRLMLATGERARAAESLMIFFMSQFAKYIPGNVAHQVGRVAFSAVRGRYAPRVIYSMVIEAGWAITSSAFLAAVSILFAPWLVLPYLPGNLTVQELRYIAVSAVAIPFIAGYIVRKAAGPLKRFLDDKIQTPDIKTLAVCFSLNVMAFLLMGGIIELIAHVLVPSGEGSLFYVTAAYSVAWIAGFLTPGAPAGLGIREVIMVAALGPLYGAANAIAVTVVLRVVTVAGDCLALGIGMIMKSQLEQNPVRTV